MSTTTSGNQDDIIDITGDGGVKKLIIKKGTEEIPPRFVRAVVHYTGKFLDGTEFDSSRKHKVPFQFSLNKRDVILGWDKGVSTMKKGEICILTCTPEYAYGNNRVGPIPPNSTLVFEIELLGWVEELTQPLSNIFFTLGMLVVLGVVGAVIIYFYKLSKGPIEFSHNF